MTVVVVNAEVLDKAIILFVVLMLISPLWCTNHLKALQKTTKTKTSKFRSFCLTHVNFDLWLSLEVMAGYDCEFVEPVKEEYKCKKCYKVSREVTLSSCCGENFCEACITDVIHKEEPCPQCGKTDIRFLEHVKYQQHISGLQVFCSMKERGCDWTGRLDQLATHLDPNLSNCQFVDINCPLHCGTEVLRKHIQDHVTSECVKREHFCRYCSYKASYEEIEGQHMPVCKYVPLQCPNRCGVTSERENMEDHLKMCPLQEIACDFNSVGCEDRFTREDQEEHNRENIQNHLSMVSRAQQKYQEAMRERLEKELVNIKDVVEQESVNIKDVAEKKNKTFEAQEVKLILQEEKLIVQEARLTDLKKTSAAMLENLVQLKESTKVEHAKLKQKNADLVKVLGITIFLASLIMAVILFRAFNYENKTIVLLDEMHRMQHEFRTFNESMKNMNISTQQKVHNVEYNLQNLYNETQNFSTSTQKTIFNMEYSLQDSFNKTRSLSMFRNGFVMTDFHAKRSAGGSWTSPAMYTHVGGYKFVLHVYASGTKTYPGGVRLSCQVVTGEFDNDLPWPVSLSVSSQVVDYYGNPSNTRFALTEWERPNAANSNAKFLRFHGCDNQGNVESFWRFYFLCHSQVQHFLMDDKLHFHVIAMVL